MPAPTRKGVDLSAGHGHPPRAADQGSPDVQVNGIPVVRQGDHYPTHCQGDDCHDGYAQGASPTVQANGKGVHRIGDAIDCGDVSAAGSSNVMVGSSPFPIFLAVEPGVYNIGGAPVYDNSTDGQKAIVRDLTVSYGSAGSGVTDADAPEPASPSPIYTSCEKFPSVITPTEMSMKVSKFFTLATCKNIPVAQRGLSASQIACNWASLCNNILDQVNENFKISFNSGFRTVASGMGNTDHGLGCAADISAGSTANTIAMFKWILNSGLPFSQIIYEKRNTAWVHVSYNGKPQSEATKVMWTYTGSAPYGHGRANLPAELQP